MRLADESKTAFSSFTNHLHDFALGLSLSSLSNILYTGCNWAHCLWILSFMFSSQSWGEQTQMWEVCLRCNVKWLFCSVQSCFQNQDRPIETTWRKSATHNVHWTIDLKIHCCNQLDGIQRLDIWVVLLHLNHDSPQRQWILKGFLHLGLRFWIESRGAHSYSIFKAAFSEEPPTPSLHSLIFTSHCRSPLDLSLPFYVPERRNSTMNNWTCLNRDREFLVQRRGREKGKNKIKSRKIPSLTCTNVTHTHTNDTNTSMQTHKLEFKAPDVLMTY